MGPESPSSLARDLGQVHPTTSIQIGPMPCSSVKSKRNLWLAQCGAGLGRDHSTRATGLQRVRPLLWLCPAAESVETTAFP